MDAERKIYPAELEIIEKAARSMKEREREGGEADGKRKRLSPHRKYDEDDKLNPGAVRRVA